MLVLDADAALDGRRRYVFQPVLRSDFRHRQRIVRPFTGAAFAPLGTPFSAMTSLVVADAWMWSPFVMLLLLAGLDGVPALFDRGRGNRPRVAMVAAVLDGDFSSRSRRAAAGASVQDDRIVQHVRSHLHDHQRRPRDSRPKASRRKSTTRPSCCSRAGAPRRWAISAFSSSSCWRAFTFRRSSCARRRCRRHGRRAESDPLMERRRGSGERWSPRRSALFTSFRSSG